MLVAGIGSLNREDAVGWRVIKQVQEHLPKEVAVFNVAVPLDLLLQLEGHDRLIVVDACLSGRNPGDVFQLEWSREKWALRTTQSSTHGWDLLSSLQLADSLGLLPNTTELLLIEIGNRMQSAQLDKAVERAVESLVTICSIYNEASSHA